MVPQKSKITSARTGQFSPRGTGLSPAGTGLSLRTRKTNFREPVSPCAGPVSHCEGALGDRSRLSGTGCLKAAATLLTGGPVSPFRDRSLRVKTLRTCPEVQFSNFLGRKTFYNPPLSVEKLEIHPSTRTSQFAKVQCVTSPEGLRSPEHSVSKVEPREQQLQSAAEETAGTFQRGPSADPSSLLPRPRAAGYEHHLAAQGRPAPYHLCP
uniref:Uncharacterized protein n=1 Tax=Ananas comosus var. bracteatus TaxID=296719 RepID=A0A6V7QLP7_ANACO|nr:unnamed protein product [Ananas comosus var. bracteatus]